MNTSESETTTSIHHQHESSPDTRRFASTIFAPKVQRLLLKSPLFGGLGAKPIFPYEAFFETPQTP